MPSWSHGPLSATSTNWPDLLHLPSFHSSVPHHSTAYRLSTQRPSRTDSSSVHTAFPQRQTRPTSDLRTLLPICCIPSDTQTDATRLLQIRHSDDTYQIRHNTSTARQYHRTSNSSSDSWHQANQSATTTEDIKDIGQSSQHPSSHQTSLRLILCQDNHLNSTIRR